MNDNRCVCCGEIIPEGCRFCPKCVNAEEKPSAIATHEIHCLKDVANILRAWSQFAARATVRLYTPAYKEFVRQFPSATERMAKVIEEALHEGEQMSFLDT